MHGCVRACVRVCVCVCVCMRARVCVCARWYAAMGEIDLQRCLWQLCMTPGALLAALMHKRDRCDTLQKLSARRYVLSRRLSSGAIRQVTDSELRTVRHAHGQRSTDTTPAAVATTPAAAETTTAPVAAVAAAVQVGELVGQCALVQCYPACSPAYVPPGLHDPPGMAEGLPRVALTGRVQAATAAWGARRRRRVWDYRENFWGAGTGSPTAFK